MLLGMLLIAVSSVCSLLLPTIMSDILDGGIYCPVNICTTRKMP